MTKERPGAEPPKPGYFRDHTVAEIRGTLVRMLQADGLSREAIAEVMRCHYTQAFRDSKRRPSAEPAWPGNDNRITAPRRRDAVASRAAIRP